MIDDQILISQEVYIFYSIKFNTFLHVLALANMLAHFYIFIVFASYYFTIKQLRYYNYMRPLIGR